MLKPILDIYRYLIAPTDQSVDSKTYRKFILIKFFLSITTVILFTFSMLHFFALEGDYTLIATIDLFAALFTLFAILHLKSANDIVRAGLIASTSLFVFFISFAFVNQNESFGLIWLVFFPVIALTINPLRTGSIFSLLFFIIMLTQSFFGIGEWQNGYWDFTSFLRFNITLAMIIMVMYLHEAAMARAREAEINALKFFEDLSLIDDLTQVANRRRINELCEIEFNRAKRYQTPFSIILIDVDNFKSINDNYGHLTGDEVLKTLASFMSKRIRSTETIGRWGGEEFIIILPQASIENAALAAEKLRKQIPEIKFANLKEPLTCSFGIAEFKKDDTLDNLIERADNALYKAKELGRNKVIKSH